MVAAEGCRQHRGQLPRAYPHRPPPLPGCEENAEDAPLVLSPRIQLLGVQIKNKNHSLVIKPSLNISFLPI